MVQPRNFCRYLRVVSSGHSVIEFLVVCAVVGSLLATILPCIHKIRSAAVSTNCIANLRVLGLGFAMYAESHNDTFPHSDRDSDIGHNYCWFDKIDDYLDVGNLNSVKQCPGWSGYNSRGYTADRHSIKMNGGLCTKEHLPEIQDDRTSQRWYWPRLWNIPEKSRTVLLVDGRMDSPHATYTDTAIGTPYADVANRHYQGTNLLMVDGSVHHVPAKSLGISSGAIGWRNSGNYLWNPYRTK